MFSIDMHKTHTDLGVVTGLRTVVNPLLPPPPLPAPASSGGRLRRCLPDGPIGEHPVKVQYTVQKERVEGVSFLYRPLYLSDSDRASFSEKWKPFITVIQEKETHQPKTTVITYHAKLKMAFISGNIYNNSIFFTLEKNFAIERLQILNQKI
jgi:hypothetical protein